jgi:hypothetical protein
MLQPVTAIIHIAVAKKLAVLCDGALLLLDYDSLEEYTVPGIRVLTLQSSQALRDMMPT